MQTIPVYVKRDQATMHVGDLISGEEYNTHNLNTGEPNRELTWGFVHFDSKSFEHGFLTKSAAEWCVRMIG